MLTAKCFQEQAAKEAAAALRDCGEVTDDVLAARKLAAAAAAAVAKSRDVSCYVHSWYFRNIILDIFIPINWNFSGDRMSVKLLS